MTQDTRKDRRVKIVSLNVRYKSATVDEFIENHAHDVSRGGIYIKTANPFPPGTLLKFEIRLASDQAVIAGVGRVVWKRDAGSSTGERPAGMGVKFIKIDDASRAIIDRLIAHDPDAGSAYTSEPAALEAEATPGNPSTLRGLVAAAPAGDASK
ncbi:MAG: TIGR02266 family protein, partial [Myxococcales bacterium]|nr:TIGR02266 family protein [Myxococcales bacterium]